MDLRHDADVLIEIAILDIVIPYTALQDTTLLQNFG